MTERLFRVLIRLLPSRDRRHRRELLEGFRYWRHRYAGDGRRFSRARFAYFITRDVLTSAGAAWLDAVRGGTAGSGGGGVDGMMLDLKYAVRRLVRTPGFTTTALLMLAVGIGVNAAAFSVVNTLLLKPPPFENADRLVELLQDSDGGQPNSTSIPAYFDIAEYRDVFSSVAARAGSGAALDLGDGAIASVSIEYATSSLLPTLGLAPSRGRWFGPADDVLEGPPVAVVSHRMWRDRLASDPEIVGRQLRLNGTGVSVIGVGPREWDGGFGADAGDLWLSWSAMDETAGPAASITRRQDHPLRVIARLADGLPEASAVDAMDGLSDRLATEFPEVNENRRIHVLPVTTLGAEQQGAAIPIAVVMMSIAIGVLLLVSINLASLLLVRGVSRRHELGIRFALGGGRGRLIRSVFAEIAVLGALGAGLGLGVGVALVRMLPTLPLGETISVAIGIDGTVLAFTVGVSLLSVIVAGLVPSVRTAAVGAPDLLGSRGSRARRFGLQGSLVAGQLAVSLLLLVVSGTFIESARRAASADPGFDVDGLAAVRVGLTAAGIPPEEARAAVDRIVERLEGVAGVESVALGMRIPGQLFGTTTLLVQDEAEGRLRPTEVPWNVVDAEYFGTVGIPLLHGRLGGEIDRDGPRRAIVNEAMARLFFGRVDVVGEAYVSEGAPDAPVEIIGVVGNAVTRTLGEGDRPTVYWPAEQGISPDMTYLIRYRGDAEDALNPMREAIYGLDASLPLLGIGTLDGFLGDTIAEQRMVSWLLLTIGAFALLLAALGVYAVVSFDVSRRANEVGIRIALGAGRVRVLGMFLRETGLLVGIGGVVGLGLAIPSARLLAAEFTGGAAFPVAVLSLCLATLVGAAVMATWLPARRAARLDPSVALREE